ncbi:phospholipase D family protein [Paraburkholderia tropica]|uniref:phospholipase D family protein n=1 Tax=Paraburkholderia tropica TaxID=92647 RepID=UPI0031D29DBF
MNVTYLNDNKTVKNAILRLTEKSSSMAWSVAWATENDIVDSAYKFRDKFSHLVVGTHGYITSPAVLERFLDTPSFKVNAPSGPLFHPKIYTFDLGDEFAAVIGSHNLTASAFSSNIEASVLLTGSRNEQVFQELCASVAMQWENASVIDEGWLYVYKANCRRVLPSQVELQRWVPIKKTSLDIELSAQDMDWSVFVAQVKGDTTHDLQGRLRVLEAVVKLLRKADTFGALDVDDRKRIAGTAGKTIADRDKVDWAWFGAMSSSGSFANVVIERPEGLSDALECIPFAGPVSQEDYERFVDKFLATFVDASRSGGIATGTRLLAMKRPDQFVCVDGPNKRGICAHFGQARTTLKLENYWERIVEPIRQTRWWLEPRPLDRTERRIWDGRAAMLDAIHYDPSTR